MAAATLRAHRDLLTDAQQRLHQHSSRHLRDPDTGAIRLPVDMLSSAGAADHNSSKTVEIIEQRRKNSRGEDVLVRRFVKGKLLGKGGFAKCYVVTCMDTNATYAMKIVPRATLTKRRAKEKLQTEIKIHRTLQHPNIVNFELFFEDRENVYILLELCHNHSMSELIRKKKRFSESEARKYMIQMLEATNYCHTNAIIHRDLKLGNLFLDINWDIKMGDFGLAAKLSDVNDRKKTICGTPNYIAPEILDEANKTGHSYQVDVWSMGVILYTMLIGKPPYESKDVKSTYRRILANVYSFPEGVTVSDEARSLIRLMLQSLPDQRPSLLTVLNHPFIRNGGPVLSFTNTYTLKGAISSSSSSSAAVASRTAFEANSRASATTLSCKSTVGAAGAAVGVKRPPLAARHTNINSNINSNAHDLKAHAAATSAHALSGVTLGTTACTSNSHSSSTNTHLNTHNVAAIGSTVTAVAATSSYERQGGLRQRSDVDSNRYMTGSNMVKKQSFDIYTDTSGKENTPPIPTRVVSHAAAPAATASSVTSLEAKRVSSRTSSTAATAAAAAATVASGMQASDKYKTSKPSSSVASTHGTVGSARSDKENFDVRTAAVPDHVTGTTTAATTAVAAALATTAASKKVATALSSRSHALTDTTAAAAVAAQNTAGLRSEAGSGRTTTALHGTNSIARSSTYARSAAAPTAAKATAAAAGASVGARTRRPTATGGGVVDGAVQARPASTATATTPAQTRAAYSNSNANAPVGMTISTPVPATAMSGTAHARGINSNSKKGDAMVAATAVDTKSHTPYTPHYTRTTAAASHKRVQQQPYSTSKDDMMVETPQQQSQAVAPMSVATSNKKTPATAATTPMQEQDTLEGMLQRLTVSPATDAPTSAAAAAPAPAAAVSQSSEEASIWVTQYVDYCSKYGLGFLMSDGSSGVYFNDATRVVLDAEGITFQYYERTPSSAPGSSNSSNSKQAYVTHKLDAYPSALQKKVTLMTHFRSYLITQAETNSKTLTLQQLQKQQQQQQQQQQRLSGAVSSQADALVHVKKFVRTRHAFLFRLSNRTVQVIFFDRTELLLCNEAQLVTYTGKDGVSRETMSLSDVRANNRTDITKRLTYCSEMLEQLVTQKGTATSK